MKRQQRLERHKALEREYLTARAATELLLAALDRDPSLLKKKGLGRSDAVALLANLEGTYLLRLFAEFEGGLRDYWENGLQETTTPRMRDLVAALVARRGVADALGNEVHSVREYRNSLVHEGGAEVTPVPLAQARKALSTFLSFLPLDW